MGKFLVLYTWVAAYVMAYILPNGYDWPFYAVAWFLTLGIVIAVMSKAMDYLMKDLLGAKSNAK